MNRPRFSPLARGFGARNVLFYNSLRGSVLSGDLPRSVPGQGRQKFGNGLAVQGEAEPMERKHRHRRVRSRAGYRAMREAQEAQESMGATLRTPEDLKRALGEIPGPGPLFETEAETNSDKNESEN